MTTSIHKAYVPLPAGQVDDERAGGAGLTQTLANNIQHLKDQDAQVHVNWVAVTSSYRIESVDTADNWRPMAFYQLRLDHGFGGEPYKLRVEIAASVSAGAEPFGIIVAPADRQVPADLDLSTPPSWAGVWKSVSDTSPTWQSTKLLELPRAWLAQSFQQVQTRNDSGNAETAQWPLIQAVVYYNSSSNSGYLSGVSIASYVGT